MWNNQLTSLSVGAHLGFMQQAPIGLSGSRQHGIKKYA